MVSIPQMTLVGQPVITTTAAPTFGAINKYNASAGSLAVTLPALTGLTVGAYCIVQKDSADTSTNTVTFTRVGGDTFDDTSTSLVLSAPGEMRTLQKISISGTS